MIQEAIQYMADIVKESMKHEELQEGATQVVYSVGGRLETVEIEPGPRRHSVKNLQSLAGYAWGSSCIWHAGNSIELVIDDKDRHRLDRVTWRLDKSAKFSCLENDAEKPRDHKSFVTFLVRYLRDEIDRDVPGLLGTIRELKFSTSDVEQGDVQHGKESMGRDIQREIAGASDLPETITLNVKRWADLEIFVPVESMLVLDTESRRLSLVPLADSIVEANLTAHRELGAMISEEIECPVYHGSV